MRRALLGAALTLLLGGAAWLTLRRGPELPSGVSGGVVFVSDRDGAPALFWRRLPRDHERRLTAVADPTLEPALSPDGTRVAFAMGGRIATVPVAGGDVRVLTLGVDWQDAQPAWLPDGRRLVVSSRRRSGLPAALHLLELVDEGRRVERTPLTSPRAGDDTSPAPAPDGRTVVFVREEHLLSVALADGRVRRLSGGFKRERCPRFLPSGRIVCAWSEGKRHGLDTLEADGRSRRTLAEGGRFYRTLAPSPDGRFLAATLSWDASGGALETLLGTEREQVRLLDAQGRDLLPLESSPWHGNHSPDWGR